MESGIKLASGGLSDWEPLGVSGDPVYRAARQIINLIRTELGADTAQTLSMPVRDDQRLTVDWYSEKSGVVKSWSQLSDTERTQLTQQLQTRLDDIGGLAQRLSGMSGESAKTYASLLKSALTYPNLDCLYSVGGNPVLVYWGFGVPSARATGMNAMGVPPMPVSPSATITPMNASTVTPPSPGAKPLGQTAQKPFWQRYGWWALLLLILLLGLLSLLRGCDTDFPLFGGKGGNGTHGGVPITPSIGGAGGVDMPVQDARTDGTGQAGVGLPGQGAGVSGEPISPITPEALKQNDLRVFHGRWSLSSSNVVNNRTRHPVQVEFSFDQQGNGSAKIIEQDGNVCVGDAHARIQPPENFAIQSDPLRCSKDATQYQPVVAACTIDRDRQADCSLRGAEGSFPAQFSRVR